MGRGEELAYICLVRCSPAVCCGCFGVLVRCLCWASIAALGGDASQGWGRAGKGLHLDLRRGEEKHPSCVHDADLTSQVTKFCL